MGWPEQRVSDADREKAADQLRAALNEGRLGFTEYDERLQAAFAAKTFADLEEVTADLPGPTLAQQARIADKELEDLAVQRSGRKPGSGLKGSLVVWVIVAVLALGIWTAISIASGRIAYFWPIWVMIPLGIAIFARSSRRR
ncbi:MAG: DUF1707 domain-containing protein [Longispora sp.]|nr:DUF1707 domain-containing protein [Longispora sp. (in: high G+C Gram-positive bacteria)]